MGLQPETNLATGMKSVKPTLLVMAAGMGSRYGGLKQIDPVGPNGETIIDYSIYDALRGGFGRIVFVIRKGIESQFRELVGLRFERLAHVDYVFQELDALPGGFTVPAGRSKPWGTTQAILVASESIQEPFAVINADDFYGAESYRLMGAYLSSGNPSGAMVGYTLRNTLSDFGTVSRGVCSVDETGCLRSAVELEKIHRDGAAVKNIDKSGMVTLLTGDEIVSMNFWGFTPAIFEQLRISFEKFLVEKGMLPTSECYIPSTVNQLIGEGSLEIKLFRTSDSWFGVTYKEDRAVVAEKINDLIQSGQYPAKLWP